jgi:AIR synthase-related protein
MSSLASLCANLREHPNVAEKLNIARAYSPALGVAGGISIGDDTAAIHDGDGFLLFAAEGMMESFIELDPWFAGYCAVMVNLSDVAAMGGRSLAIVDVLWAHHESRITQELWAGMRAASEAYGVPIVGGHTTRFPVERTPLLAAAVLGKAKRLISSFDAKPGHDLLMAVDMRAAYRGEGTVFWNASVGSPPERLCGDLELLAKLAEDGLVSAGKDISNGGLPGTFAMLLATSRCGSTVNLDALPRPEGIDLQRWLLSFPSYGYLLSVDPVNTPAVKAAFHQRDIACEVIGSMQAGGELTMRMGDERCVFAQIAPAASAPAATSP